MNGLVCKVYQVQQLLVVVCNHAAVAGCYLELCLSLQPQLKAVRVQLHNYLLYLDQMHSLQTHIYTYTSPATVCAVVCPSMLSCAVPCYAILCGIVCVWEQA